MKITLGHPIAAMLATSLVLMCGLGLWLFASVGLRIYWENVPNALVVILIVLAFLWIAERLSK